MQKSIGLCLLAACWLAALAPGSAARAATVSTATGSLTADIDPTSGAYRVASSGLGWTLGGTLGAQATGARAVQGNDAIGRYHGIAFHWSEGALPLDGEIRLYDAQPLVLFSDTCRAASPLPPAPFPDFHAYPATLHHFSYRNGTFAPAAFSLQNTSTPWLLFDDKDNALVFSPASHFQIAALTTEDGTALASGFNTNLRDIPNGFTQQTLLAFGHGINATWNTWGQGLTALGGKKSPANNADTLLKYFGYWTDNGATYYYNYDASLGYAGTLLAVAAHYRQADIPLHYMQLDSWWYEKTLDNPAGHPGGPKNPKLPLGEWNRYGGLLDYTADPFLFPNGLAAYDKTLGLPLVTHNRWIDRSSPYHAHYKISGVAAVDPKWWNDIASYLQSAGVVVYEQDWLDNIYQQSPEFSSTVGTADAFMDDMAAACASHGLDMQYCMGLPCDYLQGSRYGNLTSVRVSGDRFERGKWRDFLYTSRLASAVGTWPWTDVFNSTETNNLLLADLSAGPVGVGDAIGSESRPNIMEVMRADGVIVKPDTSLVPLDQSYIADASGTPGPLLAAATTDFGDWKACYVFAFTRGANTPANIQFTPAELGIHGPAYVYDDFAGTGRLVGSTDAFMAALTGNDGTGYYIVAPLGRSGIGFLGDSGKFVSIGRARISSVTDQPGKISATVLFAPSEGSITLHGYAPSAPRVAVTAGAAGPVQYDAASHLFSVTLRPDTARTPQMENGDLVRAVQVTFLAH